jgi:hypothetical protein
MLGHLNCWWSHEWLMNSYHESESWMVRFTFEDRAVAMLLKLTFG